MVDAWYWLLLVQVVWLQVDWYRFTIVYLTVIV
jgi:hypothetical protein